MKKTIFLILVFILMIGISVNVYAADAAKLKAEADKTTIKAGEVLTVKLSLTEFSAENSSAINSFTTKINYDSNIWEQVVQNDIKSSLLAIYNDNDNNHELTIASTNAITEGTEVATISFRAKSNIVSTMTTITFSETTINGNVIANTPLDITIAAEEIPSTPTPTQEQQPQSTQTVATLEKIEISKKPSKTVYKIGEKFNTNGMEIKAVYSDGTSKAVTDYTYSPIGELKETDSKITITYKEGLTAKSVEQKITVNETGDLPETGLENYTLAIIAVLLVATVSFIKLKKYNNI